MVRGAAGEILIPFAKSYLRKIDLEAKRVEMALPEGLGRSERRKRERQSSGEVPIDSAFVVG